MLEFLVVIKVEGPGSSVQSCEGDISARERRDVGVFRGAERPVLPEPPVAALLLLGGLDDAQTVGHIVGVATRGRVELPGDPAIVRLRILGPGLTTELFINGKTLGPRGGKLQSNIGDVIGLV